MQDKQLYKLVLTMYARIRNYVITKVYLEFKDKPVTQEGLAQLFGLKQNNISTLVKHYKEDNETL